MRNLLILLSLIPTALFAIWQPEVQATVPFPGPAALSQHSPAVASDGESWLVVWTHQGKILGALVRPDGSLQSSIPIVIDEDGNAANPAVIWNGERYLVVWRSAFFYLRAQWVSREGETIGGLIAAGDNSLGYGPSLASNGSETLVLGWQSNGMIVRRDGSKVPVPQQSLGFRPTDVASDGESFFIVGNGGEHPYPLWIARVSASGEILWRRSLPLRLQNSSIVWTGTNFLVLGRADDTSPLAVRVSTAGDAIGEPFAIAGPRALGRVSLERAGGGSVLATWEIDGGLVRLLRIEPNDVVLEEDAARDGFHPALAGADGAHLLVWAGAEAILHQRVTASGDPLEEPRLTAWSARDQGRPAVVATDAGFFAAWEERGELGARVVAGPLRARPTVVQAAVASSQMYQFDPALASSGDVVAVLWKDGGQAAAQRFTPHGVSLDQEPIELGPLTSSYYPNEMVAAAWTGRYFLLAWSSPTGLQYVRMTREGIVLDAEPMVVPQSARSAGSTDFRALAQVEPNFSVGHDQLFLAWQSSLSVGLCMILCPAPPPPPRIEGVRLDEEGMILDSSPIVLSPGEGSGEFDPEVASDGESFLVLWDDGTVIQGARVSTAGTVEPVPPLDRSLARVEGLVFTGERYFVLTTEAPPGETYDLFGSFLSLDGVLEEPIRMSSRPVHIDSYPDWPEPAGAVAAREDGTIAVLFMRIENQAGVVRRLWHRMSGSPFEPRRRAVGRR